MFDVSSKLIQVKKKRKKTDIGKRLQIVPTCQKWYHRMIKPPLASLNGSQHRRVEGAQGRQWHLPQVGCVYFLSEIPKAASKRAGARTVWRVAVGALFGLH